MHILLDAKDLINVVEHGQPMTVSQLDNYLRNRNSEVVLSYSNVNEFVAPLSTHSDFLCIRPRLQQIESLPVCYIREAPILIEEIKASIQAFEERIEPKSINPYVRRWDETFHYPIGSAAEMLVNLRLDEIVFMLWHEKPDIFHQPKSRGERLRKIIAEDRNLPENVRKDPSKRFQNTVGKHLKQWSIPPPKGGLERFCEWVYANPLRCPALRLNNLTFHEIVANIGDIGKDSDISDFAYINAIPYVDAVALDRRILDYCRRASCKLRAESPGVEYENRIYRSLEAFLQTNP